MQRKGVEKSIDNDNNSIYCLLFWWDMSAWCYVWRFLCCFAKVFDEEFPIVWYQLFCTVSFFRKMDECLSFICVLLLFCFCYCCDTFFLPEEQTIRRHSIGHECVLGISVALMCMNNNNRFQLMWDFVSKLSFNWNQCNPACLFFISSGV